MKLSMIAIGSRGDVQPIVALGRGLLDAGYAVRIVTLQSFESMVRGQGLEFFPVEGDAQALTNEMMLAGMQGNDLNLLHMYRGIMRSFGAITESYQKSFAAEELRDSDAILGQLPGGFYGYDLAELLHVPYIDLSVIPQEACMVEKPRLTPTLPQIEGEIVLCLSPVIRYPRRGSLTDG